MEKTTFNTDYVEQTIRRHAPYGFEALYDDLHAHPHLALSEEQIVFLVKNHKTFIDLGESLSDMTRLLRDSAIRSLEPFDHPTVSQFLMQLIDNPNQDCRRDAEDIIGACAFKELAPEARPADSRYVYWMSCTPL